MRAPSAWLAVLALLALGLRSRGLDFSLPHSTHSDARVLVDQIAAARAGRPDPAGHRLYPHLMVRTAALLPEPSERPAPPGADADLHRARAGGPWLRARRVSVGYSVALVPLAYALARTVLAPGPSLFAAGLTATSLLHQSFAQQERPHSALAATTALAVWLAVLARRRPSRARYLAAGLGAALAVGALHSGLAVLPALLAAHLLRGPEPRCGPARLLLPAALVAAALPLFYPFHLGGNPPDATPDDGSRLAVEERDGEAVLGLSGHQVQLEAFDGSGFGEVFGALWSYDPLLLLLSILGLAGLAWRANRPTANRRDALVLAAYAVPYTIAIGLYARTPERFVMPLTPFAAILAAAPWGRLRSGPLAAGLALVALALPTALSWRLGTLRARPDTYGEVAAWVSAELPPEETVALVLDPHQDLPLIQTPAAAEHNRAWPWPSRWAEYLAVQAELPPGRTLLVADLPGRRPGDLGRDPLGFLGELGVSHTVVELAPPGPRGRLQNRVRDALATSAELALRVSPERTDDGTGRERFFIRSVSWRRPMFARLLASCRTGPTLEVYRLP